MSAIIFVDRDGTLIEEPPDQQVDSITKVKFMPGVFAALGELQHAGFRFAMVTNQDGLGTTGFPQADFDPAHQFVIDTFKAQGIDFDAVFICPHRPEDNCACRKPKIALVQEFMAGGVERARSAMVGDRDTDMEFARRLGVRGIRVRLGGTPEETWAAVANELLARRAEVTRTTKETEIKVELNLDAVAPISIATGIGFLDHMLEQLAKHGGFSMQLSCKGDLHIDEHHTVEDSALALGEALRKALGAKLGIGRYGFVLPMDEAQVQVAIDLSGRPYAVWEGKFARAEVGGLPTELVPHFFRSLSESLGAAIHVCVTGDNTHHMVEACFKGVGRALRMAIRREGSDLPSTKGVL
ncbi:MAG: bifunctional histidinol-phosphatase/imidazoleglycerol-phosphate dehydratase HisB [Steroidobacteraceae bacterium]